MTRRLPGPGEDGTLASFRSEPVGDAESPTIGPTPRATSATDHGSGASSSPPGLPERIGSYRILGELGRGGMGVVYLAQDPTLEREVALKVLPEQLASDAQALARFQREARMLAAVNNPNIATIYTLEEDRGRRFLTMERISGSNLAERIRDGTLSVEESVALCRQLAVALEAAHRNGIVHLDLKPQNVMVTAEGTVKVLDFGLAMATGRERATPAGEGEGADTAETARREIPEDEVRTRAGSQEEISGTPGYMSPEQLRGESVDSRTDIWAFGCILFECLAGRSVFPGADAFDRARATLENEPDFAALPFEISPRVRALLARCLTREVAQRLDSVTKARRDLEEEIALRAVPSLGPRADAVPNNLPAQLTSFVGRERQREEVRRLLGEHRLVTLTGVGGGGKTRLSLEVGRDSLPAHPDGVWFVELAPVASPDLVAAATLTALGLKDASNLSPRESLRRHLKDRHALLVLDNCEHVIQAASQLADELLGACEHLRILATSREGLGVPGEATYHLESLAVPRDDAALAVEDLARLEAVQLFVARARAVQPTFALTEQNAGAVGQLCRRLDGIPLALELAAARVKVLPPEEIARRLDDRFRLLTTSSRTSLPRHQTLRALIDWSYDHLTESEQTLLRRLALFAGGWTLDAAETICAGEGIEDWEVLDLLSSLLGKSMVETDAEGGAGTGQARYRMLETIRDYARARLLERQEGAEVLERHRAYFVALAEEAAPRLMGPEQPAFLRRLSVENDNLRLAVDLCNVPGADPELGWRLGGALGRFWHMRGQWYEGRRALAELLARPDAPRISPAAAETLSWAGNLAKLQGDYPEARDHLEESLALRRRLGQEAGIASALNNLANVLKDQGDLEHALAFYEESLRLQRKLGNRVGVAMALNSLGILTHIRRDHARARAFHEESLALRREFGDRSAVAASLNNLGAAAEALGDLERATSCLQEALDLQREGEDRWGVAASLSNLGRLAEARGDLAQARVVYEEALRSFRQLGDRRGAAAALNNLGLVALRSGAVDEARALLQESLSIYGELEARASIAEVLFSLGLIEGNAGRPARAGRLLGAAESLRLAAGDERSEKAQADLDRISQRLSESPEGAAFEEGLGLGRGMDLDEAVRDGLDATA